MLSRSRKRPLLLPGAAVRTSLAGKPCLKQMDNLPLLNRTTEVTLRERTRPAASSGTECPQSAQMLMDFCIPLQPEPNRSQIEEFNSHGLSNFSEPLKHDRWGLNE